MTLMMSVHCVLVGKLRAVCLLCRPPMFLLGPFPSLGSIVGVGMNSSEQGCSIKHFERSDGSETALRTNIILYAPYTSYDKSII